MDLRDVCVPESEPERKRVMKAIRDLEANITTVPISDVHWPRTLVATVNEKDSSFIDIAPAKGYGITNVEVYKGYSATGFDNNEDSCIQGMIIEQENEGYRVILGQAIKKEDQ